MKKLDQANIHIAYQNEAMYFYSLGARKEDISEAHNCWYSSCPAGTEWKKKPKLATSKTQETRKAPNIIIQVLFLSYPAHFLSMKEKFRRICFSKICDS